MSTTSDPYLVIVGNAIVHGGDCRDVLTRWPDNYVDSIVTDPPYELGFMGKQWDATGIAYNVQLWRECLRVLKPGGHLLAFGGTRTYHRMSVAIEDAGFEIRDSIHWIYGSGFPKSLDVSKAIDKSAGAERVPIGRSYKVPNSRAVNPHFVSIAERRDDLPDTIDYAPTAPATKEARRWDGWGTALKPAHEPIVLARKPFTGTVANNVLAHGTGALNIDGTRIHRDPSDVSHAGRRTATFGTQETVSGGDGSGGWEQNDVGRWPANVIFDENAAEELGEPARYFYCPKPGKKERNAGQNYLNVHPTVKPLALMRYLIRLVTPPEGTVLEPFAGSGTTLAAATLENFNSIGIELTADYLPIIEGRLRWAYQQPPQLATTEDTP